MTRPNHETARVVEQQSDDLTDHERRLLKLEHQVDELQGVKDEFLAFRTQIETMNTLTLERLNNFAKMLEVRGARQEQTQVLLRDLMEVCKTQNENIQFLSKRIDLLQERRILE